MLSLIVVAIHCPLLVHYKYTWEVCSSDTIIIILAWLLFQSMRVCGVKSVEHEQAGLVARSLHWLVTGSSYFPLCC